MNLEISISDGYVCIPRLENGILIEFGEYDEFVDKQMMTA